MPSLVHRKRKKSMRGHDDLRLEAHDRDFQGFDEGLVVTVMFYVVSYSPLPRHHIRTALHSSVYFPRTLFFRKP